MTKSTPIKRKKYESAESWVGKRFGKLTVKAFLGYGTSTQLRKYLCLCDCGNKCEKWSTSFYRKYGEHCGCDSTHNGKMKHPLYKIWSVHSGDVSWSDFKAFADRCPKTSPQFWLSRIDKYRRWTADNLKWVPRGQSSPRRRIFTLQGKTLDICGWAKLCGVTKERIRQRLLKYPPEKAIGEYLDRKASKP